MKRKPRRKHLLGRFLLILACIAVICSVFFGGFYVTKYEVAGNSHVTDKQVIAYCGNSIWMKNSILASRFKSVIRPDAPLIEKIDVEYASRNQLRLVVTERVIVGYYILNDSYYFFDQNGKILQITKAAEDGIPKIEGLKTKQLKVGGVLDQKYKNTYRTILSIKKLTDKFEIAPEAIQVGTNAELTLVYGATKIAIGSDENLEEKIAHAAAIYPQIKGQEGVLHLENYSKDVQNIIFGPES